jgi:O-methyltransferase domain/Dimerisation domain
MTTTDSPSTNQPTPAQAEALQELILAAWMSQAITAAADLRIADALSGGPLPVEELAAKVGANPDALRRLLRVLIGRGIFLRRDDDRYELNPMAQLLRSDSPISMAAMARFIGARQHREHWSMLTQAIKSGDAAVPALRGKGFFDYLGDEPEFGQIFNDAMTSLSGATIGPVIDTYDFAPYRTIVDVAGGHGRLLAAILGSAPDARGVLYDLPEVIAGAESLLSEAGVAERVQLAEGSFFDSVPAGGDAYLLKNIIHDWDDEPSLQILRNVRSAAATGAALLLLEAVVPDDDSESTAKLTDMEMLLINNGRERTVGEYRGLLDESGFRLTRVVDTNSRFSIIEARAV